MTTGTLYLIPVALGENLYPHHHRPPEIAELTDFVVENAKTGRAHIKRLKLITPLPEISLQVLDEHTPSEMVPELLAPLLAGRNMGLMSEAGCPAVADPGASVVELAHQRRIRVVPLVGPCAIVLALMASGLNGQRFAFHGYLPSEWRAREDQIRELEQESRTRTVTQIFIEAPYRNRHLLASLLECMAPSTRLCIAVDLTLPTENIQTRNVAEWKKTPPELHKKPTVFLLQAG